MNTAARLAAFAAALLVVFAFAFGVGRLTAPDETAPERTPSHVEQPSEEGGTDEHAH